MYRPKRMKTDESSGKGDQEISSYIRAFERRSSKLGTSPGSTPAAPDSKDDSSNNFSFTFATKKVEQGSHATEPQSEGQDVDSVIDNEATNLYYRAIKNKKRRYSIDGDGEDDGDTLPRRSSKRARHHEALNEEEDEADVNPCRRASLEASNFPALNAETASEGNTGTATEPWPSEPEEEENHENNSAGESAITGAIAKARVSEDFEEFRSKLARGLGEDPVPVDKGKGRVVEKALCRTRGPSRKPKNNTAAEDNFNSQPTKVRPKKTLGSKRMRDGAEGYTIQEKVSWVELEEVRTLDPSRWKEVMVKLPEDQHPIFTNDKEVIKELIDRGIPYNSPSLTSQKAQTLLKRKQEKDPAATVTRMELIDEFHVCQMRDSLQGDGMWRVSETACGQGFVDREGYRRHVQEKHLNRSVASRRNLKEMDKLRRERKKAERAADASAGDIRLIWTDSNGKEESFIFENPPDEALWKAWTRRLPASK